MHKVNYPVLALIAANIIWGAASPIFKFSLENISPFLLAFLRFLISCLILYPVLHKRLSYDQLKNPLVWLFALCGTTLNIAFFFLAIQRTASINAPIIGCSGPVFILIGSHIFLRERPKVNAIIGTIIALLGVLLIVFTPNMESDILGNFLLILATLSAAGQALIGKKILTPENTFALTFWAFFIATISFFPLMLWEFSQNPMVLSTLDNRGWVGILFGSVFSSVAAYMLYHWAISKMPAFKTSVFAYLDPVAAILIAVPLLGEKITVPFVVGSILVFLGILVAEKRIHWHPIHRVFQS